MSWWHILSSINACLTAKWQISSWSLITHDRFKQNTFLVQIWPMLPTIKAQNEQKPNRPVQLIQPLFIQACNSSSVGRYVGEYVMVCLVRITILSPNPIFHTVWPLPPTQCPQLECWLWWTVGRSSRWGHCISGYGCRRSISKSTLLPTSYTSPARPPYIPQKFKKYIFPQKKNPKFQK